MLQKLSKTVFMFLCAFTILHADYKPSGEVKSSEVYILGIHPYANPQTLFGDYEFIIKYLEQKIPNTKFKLEASKDYADYEDKLSKKRFDFSLPNPYQTIYSFKYGYHVIVKMTPDEDFGGLIITKKGSKIKSFTDLENKTICVVSPSAVAATMLPLMFLNENGVNVSKDLKVRYVGSQDSTILNAKSGECDISGSTVRFFRSWSNKNPDLAKEITVLWKTEPFVHNAIIAKDDVPADIRKKVADALVQLSKDPSVDQSIFKKDQQYFEYATDAKYNKAKKFFIEYDKVIGLPDDMKGNK